MNIEFVHRETAIHERIRFIVNASVPFWNIEIRYFRNLSYEANREILLKLVEITETKNA